MFCSVDLAARIERAEAELMSDVATAARRRVGDPNGFTMPIAGGVATFVEPGSPYNKVAGVGFAGAPSESELEEVEAAFAARDEPTSIELAHLADPSVIEFLAEHGYRLAAFENVLGLTISDTPFLVPTGIDVRLSTTSEFDLWLDVMAGAVANPDTQGIAWHDEFPRDIYVNALRDSAAAGVQRYDARRDGVLAGGAGLRITDGIAQFAGAATAPAHRRHGVQTALLAARLTDAAAAGCDLGVVITQPGSKSAQNVQRQGFDLLYTRAVLAKGA